MALSLSYPPGMMLPMSRAKTIYRCGECGGAAPKWVGRCPACQAWNTLVEELDVTTTAAVVGAISSRDAPVPIGEVELDEWHPRPTLMGEVDRVLGGGLVPGSVTLIGG